MIARVNIQTVLKNGITKLHNCYFEPPCKLMDITEVKTSNELHVMQMSSSPGLLDNDDIAIQIMVEKNCFLQLHTQSYQRLFTMQNGATQSIQVTIKEGATFVYLPHPIVPHEQSIFRGNNNIYLSKNSTLCWGEIITCGRKLNNEIFALKSYQSITQVFVEGKLIIKDNVFIEPKETMPSQLGLLDNYTHQATFIYLNEQLNVEHAFEKIMVYIKNLSVVSVGISITPINGFAIRILGHKAEQLFKIINTLKTFF